MSVIVDAFRQLFYPGYDHRIRFELHKSKMDLLQAQSDLEYLQSYTGMLEARVKRLQSLVYTDTEQRDEGA